MRTYILTLVALQLGCASDLNGVRQSLTESAKLVQASADAFDKSDLAYQRTLEVRPDAVAAVQKYRAEVQPQILRAFVAAGAILLLGQATCAAVDVGAKTRGDLAQIMVEVFNVLRSLQQLLGTIGQPELVPPAAPSSARRKPVALRRSPNATG